jgi:hypothetical protein
MNQLTVKRVVTAKALTACSAAVAGTTTPPTAVSPTGTTTPPATATTTLVSVLFFLSLQEKDGCPTGKQVTVPPFARRQTVRLKVGISRGLRMGFPKVPVKRIKN